MSEEEIRKLAAIMFTDMVGYSALSQRDDKLALELLEEHRELLRGIFVRFHGTEIKTIGDAFLVEFNSALEAAQCAIAIQRALVKRNADVPPDRRIELKIGIHIGDVVHRGGDVYGDGVNIASRIEPLAGAGGICVSMDVERQIRNAVETSFEKLAPTELKNISAPMDLFRIVLPWERQVASPQSTIRSEPDGRFPQSEIRGQNRRKFSTLMITIAVIVAGLLGFGIWRARTVSTSRQSAGAARTEAGTVSTATIPEKSIAVLPLVNTSGDPSNEYFSDGLSEELIAVLSKVPGLKVIGRSSSFAFKGKSEDSRTIGEKLGVSRLLEGSVRKQGDRVRIVAELINASDGGAIWSETYDRELKDVFAVQSDIATAVSAQLKVKLLGGVAKSDAAPSNDNLAAYNAWQQGNFYLQQSSAESCGQAVKFFEEAVRLDPGYALAYAGLSSAERQIGASWAAEGEILPAYEKARSAAKTALSLAPKLAAAHEAAAWLLVTPDFNYPAADSEFRQAEQLAPSDAGPKLALAYLLAAQGRIPEAEAETRQALALDPLRYSIYVNLARILIVEDRYDEAEAALHKVLELQPSAARPHTYLTAIALLRGDAAKALQNAELESPGFWRDFAVTLATQAQSDRNKADASLQDFEANNSRNGPFQIAVVYAFRKQPDKMFEWLDRAYAEHDSGLTQLFVTPFLSNYRSDPRFTALCQKLKVTIPGTDGIKQ